MSHDPTQLHERILRLLAQPKYQPLDKVELSKALNIHSSERRVIREMLRDMEQQGLVARIRKDRYVLPDTADLVTGVLQVHQNGAAHLLNERRDQPDIFISATNTGTAMHGDKVVARLMHEGREQRGGAGAKLEGRVIRILDRANEHRRRHAAIPKNLFSRRPRRLRASSTISTSSRRSDIAAIARAGDKVVVQARGVGNRHVNPEGEIIEVSARPTRPAWTCFPIIRKYKLPLDFPEAVEREAERIPETVDPRKSPGAKICRGQFIVTIDPDDANDFDDAIHVERTRTAGGSASTSPTSRTTCRPETRSTRKPASAAIPPTSPIA